MIGMKMITTLAANKLGKFLARDFRRVFGPAHDEMAERLGSLARSTIECLARSDALYHNFEHTLQVTMVGLLIPSEIAHHSDFKSPAIPK
jgi:hypothetical protein